MSEWEGSFQAHASACHSVFVRDREQQYDKGFVPGTFTRLRQTSSPRWLESVLPNALTRRLEEYTPLTEVDRDELAQLCAQSTHTIPAKRDLISEGDAPRSIYVILQGWACHYRTLENGRRQIVDFAIPGDLCDLNLFILDRMDHSICAITRLRVAEVGREVFRRVVTHFPNITTALWWVELVSKSIHREWLVSVGQRSARERVAHLFCELFLRLESVGLTDGFSCDFPLTQSDIADTTGMTAIHVNRTIQELRRDGLILLERHRLTIPDMLALQRAGLFNPDYLHIRRLNRHTDVGRSKQESDGDTR
jgi:CRP-like cAMP-binding protein